MNKGNTFFRQGRNNVYKLNFENSNDYQIISNYYTSKSKLVKYR